MNSAQESRDTARTNGGFRARSDSLDIFTMSPLVSPSLDTQHDDLVPPHLRLPEPPAFDLDSALKGSAYQTPHYTSPPSTPNSPTSFSFSPPLRAYVPGDTYGGTSYGTDMTSLVGSWSPSANVPYGEDEPREDKGKAVRRDSIGELGSAPESAVENGKGKARAIDLMDEAAPFEFDFDFQHDGGALDLSEPAVVRLSPGSHYRQFSETSAGPSSCVVSAPVGAEPYNLGPVQRSLTPESAPSCIPSTDALPTERLRLPTHRRSFSSLSIRSIRSSSSRSMASLRSAVSGASIRGRVKSMAPAAKKLKGGLRRMFKRQDTKLHAGPDTDDSGESSDDDDGDEEDVPESGFPYKEPSTAAEATLHASRHIPEESADSYKTIRPATPGALHIAEGVAEDRRAKPRSMSAPLPFTQPSHEESELEIEVEMKTETTVQEGPKLLNRFNDLLPRELQLAVLRMLVVLHETEHLCAERGEGPHAWTARVAGRTRWSGRDKGMRELIKLTRVSKAWQVLAFDGQLWAALHLASSPPHLTPALLLRLAEHAGPFVRSLDLRGWNHLDPVTLRALVRSLAHDTSPRVAPAPPFPPTNLTHVALRTCTALTAHSLHHVLLRAPALRSVDLHGLAAVTNTTCGVLAAYCPRLAVADLRRCVNMDGEGLVDLVGGGIARSWASVEGVFRGADAAVETGTRRSSALRVLRASGTRRVDEDVMAALAQGAPELEVLDLSGARELTDGAVAAFVAWDESWDDASEDSPRYTKVELSAREMGRDPTAEYGPFYKRVTRLRHLNFSSCPLLTDTAGTHLAHCVPQLEFLELAGIDHNLKDDGLVRLLGTVPRLRRLDLEDACDITDAVLDALTPASASAPGHALEHLILSYALNVTNDTLLALVRRCTRLAVLECDNTRISGSVVREFVRLAQERRLCGAELVAVDCRAITEALIKDLAGAGQTRARRGFRHYEARALGFVDKRDGESLGAAAGMDVDDCDEMRVALKSFWSWQGVDALRRERERRQRLALTTRRNTDAGETFRRLGLLDDEEDVFGMDGAGPSTRPRWLGHWTRVSSAGSGSSSPRAGGLNTEEDRGCTIM